MKHRWGIIGTGEVAYEIAFALRHLPNNDLVAVASRKKENAERFASITGVGQVYDSYQDLISNENVDIVYIAVPNNLHYELNMSCLSSGKHVLCEKPFALNANQAMKVKELANQSGLFCMEAMWTRFIPSVQRLHQIVRSGDLGQIKFVDGSFGHLTTGSSLFSLENGGGVLLDLGVYLISNCVSLFGRPDKVDGMLDLTEGEVDRQATILLTYKNGMIANFNCSFLTNLNNHFSVHGEKGVSKILTPFYRSAFIEMQYSGNDDKDNKPAGGTTRNMYRFPGFLKYLPFCKRVFEKYLLTRNLIIPFKGSAYHYQLLEVNRCLEQKLKESPIMPLDNTIMTLEVMDSIRQKHNYSFPNE